MMGPKVQCNKCKQIIQSKSVHDFVRCSCKAIFVDGGAEYLRLGGELADITIIEEEKEDIG